MLEVSILKRLGDFRLDVSFQTAGGVMGLLGASGCGKSLTLKCVAGLISPDSGRIVLNGRVLFDSARRINLRPQQRRVGYLFQQYALFPNMTARQNVLAGCRMRDRPARAESTDGMLRRMGLSAVADHRPSQLSGGQQQRVALARILINEPELLLLDEPLAALDSYMRWQLENQLADTIRDYAGGTLYVSHSREEIYRLCDHVCVLTRGRSEPSQGVRELFEQPGTLSACLLSGCKNFSRTQPQGEGLVMATDWGAVLRLPHGCANDKPLVGVRAHFVRVSAAPPDDPLAFPCLVQRVTQELFATVLTLSTPGGETGWSQLRVDLPKEAWASMEGADTLYASIAPAHLMPLDE